MFRFFFLFLILIGNLGIPERTVNLVHQFGGRLIYWRRRDYWYWSLPLFEWKMRFDSEKWIDRILFGTIIAFLVAFFSGFVAIIYLLDLLLKPL